MRHPTIGTLRELLTNRRPPCMSLYQPTHRSFPEKQQNPIRYKNLLRRIRAAVAELYAGRESEPILERFDALARDEGFWLKRGEAFAILASPERFEVFDLKRSVPSASPSRTAST